jgi:hypothetical protein
LDAQRAISASPLVVVGGAGSGKTALTLEKMKLADGEAVCHALGVSRAERT